MTDITPQKTCILLDSIISNFDDLVYIWKNDLENIKEEDCSSDSYSWLYTETGDDIFPLTISGVYNFEGGMTIMNIQVMLFQACFGYINWSGITFEDYNRLKDNWKDKIYTQIQLLDEYNYNYRDNDNMKKYMTKEIYENLL